MKNLIQLVRLVLAYNKKENRIAVIHLEFYEWGVELKVFMEVSLDYIICIQSNFDKSVNHLIQCVGSLIENDIDFINETCPIIPSKKSTAQRRFVSRDFCHYK